MSSHKERSKKTLTGTVVSDKMNKTIVVRVDSKRSHPIYTKLVKRSIKFKVHDEKNHAKTGDTVRIMSTRPISREKRWRLVEVVASKHRPEEG